VATDALITCRICGLEAHIEEELELFHKKKTNNGILVPYGRENYCKNCRNKYNRKYRKENKFKTLEWGTKGRCKHIYNITLEEYYKRMSTSDCCEICGSKKRLSYDHCHDTLKFRGVLCSNCNRGIGQLGDTIEAVEKALFYLNKEEKVI
tara:strand:+ start:53 stop:502 length:450 start_codon:yes stop_codon:yes gene_type:complete